MPVTNNTSRVKTEWEVVYVHKKDKTVLNIGPGLITTTREEARKIKQVTKSKPGYDVCIIRRKVILCLHVSEDFCR